MTNILGANAGSGEGGGKSTHPHTCMDCDVAKHAPTGMPWAVQGGFLPFLPNDNRGLADSDTQAVVECISADLGALLAQPAAAFWEVVGGDASLQACLDSFLRFRRCGGSLGGRAGS